MPTIVTKQHTVARTFPVESLVEAVQQATVGAQISARILEVKADAGQRVKKGEVLMRIDARQEMMVQRPEKVLRGEASV